MIAKSGLFKVIIVGSSRSSSHRHRHLLVLRKELPHVVIGHELVSHGLLSNLGRRDLLSSYMLNKEIGMRGILLQPVAALVEDGEADLEAAQGRELHTLLDEVLRALALRVPELYGVGYLLRDGLLMWHCNLQFGDQIELGDLRCLRGCLI